MAHPMQLTQSLYIEFLNTRYKELIEKGVIDRWWETEYQEYRSRRQRPLPFGLWVSRHHLGDFREWWKHDKYLWEIIEGEGEQNNLDTSLLRRNEQH